LVCTPKVNEKPVGQIRNRLVQSLVRYGFRESFRYEPNSSRSSAGRALCLTLKESPPTLLFALGSEADDSFTEFGRFSRLFVDRLKAIRAAKLAVFSDAGELDGITTGSLVPTGIWSTVGTLFVLLFCPLSSFAVGAKFLSAVWTRLPALPRQNRLTMARVFAPSQYPMLYALAPIRIWISHVALITMLMVIVEPGIFGNNPTTVLNDLGASLTPFFAVVAILLLPIGIMVCNAKLSHSVVMANKRIYSTQMVVYIASTITIVAVFARREWMDPDTSGHTEPLVAMLTIGGGAAASCLYTGLAAMYRAVPVILIAGVMTTTVVNTSAAM
jgi:hypothetical protein